MTHCNEACKLELAADLVDADVNTPNHLAALLLLHNTSTREQRQPHHKYCTDDYCTVANTHRWYEQLPSN